MIKKFSLILLILIANFSCKNKESESVLLSKKFTLTGTITGDYDDYIFLGYGKHKDSTKVINGKFEFSGELDLPTQQGWINLRPLANNVFVYLEGSNINLKTEFNKQDNDGRTINILKIKDIKGSKTALIQKRYKDFWKENKEKDSFNKLLYDELNDILSKNPKNSFSGKLLGDIASRHNILSVSELENLYSLIDTTYQNKYDLLYYNEGIKSLKNYNIGNDFISVELKNSEGEHINLNSIKSKYILIDFWASWCKPCRDKHPKLLEMYLNYDRNTFEIFGISIDENLDKWKNAIKQDSLTWKNVIDIESKISNDLGITAIPHSYLLDENNKIVLVNPSLDEVQQTIEKQSK